MLSSNYESPREGNTYCIITFPPQIHLSAVFQMKIKLFSWRFKVVASGPIVYYCVKCLLDKWTCITVFMDIFMTLYKPYECYFV